MRFARPEKREPAEQERPDLAAVFEYYGTSLSGRARQMVRCPVHGDRHASCSVDLEKQLFNCHSCDAGGTSWDLIMEKEGVDHQRARAFAAAQQFPTGDTGGGDSGVSSGYVRRRRPVSPGKGNRPGRSSYVPAWRRR